jgi:hypothetical protein
MLGEFSDSSLGSWSFWLQHLGIAGAIGVVVSLVGMHLVSTEMSARVGKITVPAGHAAAPIADNPVVHAPAEKPQPKLEIAPPKPSPPREITEEQKSAFVSELADAPKHSFPVVIFDQDPEVRSYADQVRVMLELAGYDCGPTVKTNSPSTVSAAGLMIVVKDPARAPSFAGAIQKAFKAIGIDALGAKDGDFGDDQVAVVVGRRKD